MPDVIMRLLKEAVPEKEWVASLAQWDQVDLLKSLLETSEFDEDALNYGFEQSLRYVAPHCLDVLNQYATEHNISFRERHPFDLMYSECRVSNKFAECTRILIKHGWSVNSVPSPIYSLIDAVKKMRQSPNVYVNMTEDSYESVYHNERERKYLDPCIPLDCLEALLNAGADPNLKETSYPFDIYINRHYNNSAAEALMRLLRYANLFYRESLWTFLSKAVGLLVQHDCDLSFVDVYGQSFLHVALSEVSMCIANNVLHMVDSDSNFRQTTFDEKIMPMMVQTITYAVKNRADLRGKDVYGRYPLVNFAECLKSINDSFRKIIMRPTGILKANVYYQIWNTLTQRIKVILDFLNVMEHSLASEVVKWICYIIKEDLVMSNGELVGQQLLALLESHKSISLRSLQSICVLKVYYACKFQPEKLEMFSKPYMQLFDDIFPTVKIDKLIDQPDI